MHKANCGASVKSSQKPKKMNMGGFMKIGDDLQKLDVNKRREKMNMSSGGMAEKRRAEKAKEEEKKGGKKYKKGELVDAAYGKHVKKKKPVKAMHGKHVKKKY